MGIFEERNKTERLRKRKYRGCYLYPCLTRVARFTDSLARSRGCIFSKGRIIRTSLLARYSYLDDKVLPDTGSWADTISFSISEEDLLVFEATHGCNDAAPRQFLPAKLHRVAPLPFETNFATAGVIFPFVIIVYLFPLTYRFEKTARKWTSRRLQIIKEANMKIIW